MFIYCKHIVERFQMFSTHIECVQARAHVFISWSKTTGHYYSRCERINKKTSKNATERTNGRKKEPSNVSKMKMIIETTKKHLFEWASGIAKIRTYLPVEIAWKKPRTIWSTMAGRKTTMMMMKKRNTSYAHAEPQKTKKKGKKRNYQQNYNYAAFCFLLCPSAFRTLASVCCRRATTKNKTIEPNKFQFYHKNYILFSLSPSLSFSAFSHLLQRWFWLLFSRMANWFFLSLPFAVHSFVRFLLHKIRFFLFVHFSRSSTCFIFCVILFMVVIRCQEPCSFHSTSFVYSAIAQFPLHSIGMFGISFVRLHRSERKCDSNLECLPVTVSLECEEERKKKKKRQTKIKYEKYFD